jgi:hypothetical protein
VRVGHGQRDDPTNGMTNHPVRSTHMNQLSLAVTNGFMLTPSAGVTKVSPEHPTNRAARTSSDQHEAPRTVPLHPIGDHALKP